METCGLVSLEAAPVTMTAAPAIARRGRGGQALASLKLHARPGTLGWLRLGKHAP